MVTDALCVLDRDEGGTTTLADHGVIIHALFTAAELRTSFA